MTFVAPYLGHGIVLRPVHQDALLQSAAGAVDWVEAASETVMDLAGEPFAQLEVVRARMPVVLHGMSLSIGGASPLDGTYLRELRRLIQRIQPAWVSDNLSWVSHSGRSTHQRLPLPYTEEAFDHVAERLERVQEALGMPLMLQNVSSTLRWRASARTAADFLAALAQRTGCGVLLDVSGAFVDAHNHDVDAQAFLDAMPAAQVRQVRLAGNEDRGTHFRDSYACAVSEPVWDLYRRAVQKFGKLSTVVQWDESLPNFETLVAEVDRARAVEAAALLNPLPHRKASPVPVATRQDAHRLSLQDCQRLLCDYVVQPEPLRYSQALHDTFIKPKRGDVGNFLRTHHDVYWTRITTAMRTDYPLTRRFLGAKIFDAYARAYVTHHPSSHHDVLRAGAQFGQWLRPHDVVAAQLAALEWAGLHVATRPVDAAATIDVLRSVTPEQAMTVRMQLVKQLTWLELDCDVDAVLCQLILNEKTGGISVQTNEGALMALWRNGKQVERAHLPPHEFVALERVRAGATLSQVCDLLSDYARTFHGEMPAVVLKRWFHRGWVAGLG